MGLQQLWKPRVAQPTSSPGAQSFAVLFQLKVVKKAISTLAFANQSTEGRCHKATMQRP